MKAPASSVQAQKEKASSSLQKLRAARLQHKEALTASGTKVPSKGKAAGKTKVLDAAAEETKHKTTHTASLMARLGVSDKHEDEAEDESKDAVLDGLMENDAHVKDDFGFSQSLSKLTGAGGGGFVDS